jgi:hypothetical protein
VSASTGTHILGFVSVLHQMSMVSWTTNISCPLLQNNLPVETISGRREYLFIGSTVVGPLNR